MHLIAHRGLHQHQPENTLAAFQAALDAGFEGIETDVRLSADGLPVIMHDRILRNGMPVAALTRAEIAHVAGHAVPTLPETLEVSHNCLWNIEIKTASVLPTVLPILAASQHSHRLLVTSFRHEVVLACAEQLPAVPCGLLVAHRPAAFASLAHAALHFHNIRTVVWDYEILDLDIQRLANSLGFKNYVYGAHTDYEHALCREFGIHGVITDHPEFVGLHAAPPATN
jgi:glycerophosphoryl diester phosphodiesterase